MKFVKLSKVVALILFFFLLSGFSLIGPDYKELYKEEQQKTHFIRKQRDDYKERYEQEVEQRKNWEGKINQIQQENQELGNNNARLKAENELLKGGLDSLQEALLEKQNQLEKREEELDQEKIKLSEDKNQLRQDRNNFNEEIRKIGQLEGELVKLREENEQLSQNVRSLQEKTRQKEKDRNWWQGVAIFEAAVLLVLMIGFLINNWQRSNNYSRGQTIPVSVNDANDQSYDQLSENKSDQKSLAQSNETTGKDSW